MANLTTAAQLATARDNLLTAYTQLCTSGVRSYSLGDRTVSYEDRGALLKEIQELDKLIARKDSALNGRGNNRANFKSWR